MFFFWPELIDDPGLIWWWCWWATFFSLFFCHFHRIVTNFCFFSWFIRFELNMNCSSHSRHMLMTILFLFPLFFHTTLTPLKLYSRIFYFYLISFRIQLMIWNGKILIFFLVILLFTGEVYSNHHQHRCSIPLFASLDFEKAKLSIGKNIIIIIILWIVRWIIDSIYFDDHNLSYIGSIIIIVILSPGMIE